jgi:hypothetical protein
VASAASDFHLVCHEIELTIIELNQLSSGDLCERNNICYDATIAELAAHGVRDYEKEEGRHIKIKFYLRGRERMIVVSRSPSDHRAAHKARSGR